MPLCHDLAPIDSLEGSKCFRIGVPVEKKEGNVIYTTSRMVLHVNCINSCRILLHPL